MQALQRQSTSQKFVAVQCLTVNNTPYTYLRVQQQVLKLFKSVLAMRLAGATGGIQFKLFPT
jgi:hypothetical protein